MSRILMTGAAGGVASMLRPHLAGHFDEVVLSDIVPVTGMAAHERFVEAPLADPGACRAACRGMDGIVHLGGFAHEGPWETIHEANIVGCYNIFEAARLEGVPRVVFASSSSVYGDTPTLPKQEDMTPTPMSPRQSLACRPAWPRVGSPETSSSASTMVKVPGEMTRTSSSKGSLAGGPLLKLSTSSMFGPVSSR